MQTTIEEGDDTCFFEFVCMHDRYVDALTASVQKTVRGWMRSGFISGV